MSAYDIEINGGKADHYDLEDAARVGQVYQVGDSALEHARKKLRAAGERGNKSRLKDIREARESLDRAIEQMVKAECRFLKEPAESLKNAGYQPQSVSSFDMVATGDE